MLLNLLHQQIKAFFVASDAIPSVGRMRKTNQKLFAWFRFNLRYNYFISFINSLGLQYTLRLYLHFFDRVKLNNIFVRGKKFDILLFLSKLKLYNITQNIKKYSSFQIDSINFYFNEIKNTLS